MQFVTRVLTDLTKCKTPADYYRVQMEISKHATPHDVAILSNRPIEWPDEFDRWLNLLTAGAAAVRKDPAPYRLVELDRFTSLYSGENRAPNLLWAFCGKAGLLFMPLPLILQYFSPQEYDVLVVREAYKGEEHDSDLRGSFHGMIEELRAAVGMTRYRDIKTFGTSAGGAAALAAGVVVNASAAVSFSGHLPTVGVTYRSRASALEVEEILRDARPSVAFSCVYGAENEFDVEHAMALSSFLPLRHFPITGVSGHNVVHALHMRHELARVFADVGLT